MNPLTNVKNINKLNEIELSTGLIHKKSWHDMYKGSAWIFIGGLEYGLTEGDVITVFSQYGEVVNINLIRDKKTGKSKGYCFLCYANQKSTVLAVDNLNGIKLCNRTIRVDHVADYKPPKEDERDDEITKMLKSEGCAPKPSLLNESSVASNFQTKKKKSKKEKKKKKKKHDSDENNSGNDDSGFPKVKVKKEKHDYGYDKYDTALNVSQSRSEKRNHLGSRFEDSNDASSHSRDKVKSNQDQMHQNVHERSSRHGDQFVSKHRSKERSWHESEGREKCKEYGEDDRSLAKNIKRERSSSPEESSRKYKKDVRHGTERRRSKSKHSDSKRREKYSSSSSSDQDSSSQSSSEDEHMRTESRNSRSDQHRNYNEKREENRQDYRHVPRTKTNEFASSKKYHSREKEYEYNSKDKYRGNDRHDSHNRDSYSKYKYDKR